MRCFSCGGPYHPATGHLFAGFDDVAYCGGCYRPFARWMTGHMKRKWSGMHFYDAAATSIRAGIWPSPGEEKGIEHLTAHDLSA